MSTISVIPVMTVENNLVVRCAVCREECEIKDTKQAYPDSGHRVCNECRQEYKERGCVEEAAEAELPPCPAAPCAPTTRGELVNMLKCGNTCRVAPSCAEMTEHMLRGWLQFSDFIVMMPTRPTDWALFIPTDEDETEEDR